MKVFALYRHWGHLNRWLSDPVVGRGTGGTETRTMRVCVLCGMVVAFAMLIVMIELTIVWNTLSGVSDLRSTGQLIPLIIGLTALGQMALYRKADSLVDEYDT